MDEFHLDVPEGVNAHLMFEDSNPPKRPRQVARVGYWLAQDEKGEIGAVEWFEVNGSEAEAQTVLDEQVAPHLLDAVAAQIGEDEKPKETVTTIDKRKAALEKARATRAANQKAAKAESKGADKAAPVPKG